MKIDKSVFTADELVQYEALIAKAKVDPEAGEEEMEDEKPSFFGRKNPPMRKEDDPMDEEDFYDEEDLEEEDMDKSRCKKGMSPEMEAAMKRLAILEKSYAMKEFTEIAKKYAPLGEDETELAKTLYDMKQSNEANYNAYISILDKSLGMVEKSGIFAEIGKSTSGAGGNVLARVDAAADDIMKSDASITKEQAIAKAWENHPELIAEYEAEYRKA